MKIKRVLAFTAALTLMFSAYCQPVFAEGSPTIVSSGTIEDADEPENKIAWSLDTNGTLTISGNGAARYNDWNSEIDNADVRYVVVESGITQLPDGAFIGYPVLESVSLPDTLTEIGTMLFFDCPLLNKVNIPDSVTKIGSAYLDDPSGELIIPDSVESIESIISTSPKITVGSSVKLLESYAFRNHYLSELTIKNPDCVIKESDTYNFCDFTLKGYKGSTAEKYAKEHQLNFEAIDSDYKNDYSLSREFPLYGNSYGVEWSARKYDDTIVFEFGPFSENKNNLWRKFKDRLNVNKIEVMGPIPEGAFMDFDKVTEVLVHDEVPIGADTFKNCTSLKTVFIRKEVNRIDKTAFTNCSPDLCIEGYSGSYAEQYAKENNIKFESIDVISSVSDIKGDANCDKTVDMSDAVLIMQSLSNPSKYKLTEQGRENADFDGDGVTNGDALTIQKKLLKLD